MSKISSHNSTVNFAIPSFFFFFGFYPVWISVQLSNYNVVLIYNILFASEISSGLCNVLKRT